MRKLRRAAIIIGVLTTVPRQDLRCQAFRRKASGYLLKDSAASELTTAIREALQNKSYVSPLIAKGIVNHTSASIEDVSLRELSPREREVLQLLAGGGQ
jgi:DNA-binding NarL/FixJ family response regulator